MVRINWTHQAKQDLKSIAEFISIDSKTYAKRQVLKLKGSTKILKHQKFIGKTVLEFDNEAIRELVIGDYRIIYRIQSSARIDILTVHHSARDLRLRKIF
jgi:toxin ParE1/3/4